jgi:hypothetical protein
MAQKVSVTYVGKEIEDYGIRYQVRLSYLTKNKMYPFLLTFEYWNLYDEKEGPALRLVWFKSDAHDREQVDGQTRFLNLMKSYIVRNTGRKWSVFHTKQYVLENFLEYCKGQYR